MYLRFHVVSICVHIFTYPCCFYVWVCTYLSMLYLYVRIYCSMLYPYLCMYWSIRVVSMCARVFTLYIYLSMLYLYVCMYLPIHVVSCNFYLHLSFIYIYLTIIPRGRVGYEMKIANETSSVELAIIISYPTSESGIIVLLKTPTKSRWISPT